jgi:hypothetical protein
MLPEQGGKPGGAAFLRANDKKIGQHVISPQPFGFRKKSVSSPDHCSQRK